MPSRQNGGSSKLRLRMNITLYDEKGKTVLYTTKRIRRGLGRYLCGGLTPEWKSGRIRIWYNSRKGLYNEFEFEDIDEFNEKISPCVEADLLKELVTT